MSQLRDERLLSSHLKSEAGNKLRVNLKVMSVERLYVSSQATEQIRPIAYRRIADGITFTAQFDLDCGQGQICTEVQWALPKLRAEPNNMQWQGATHPILQQSLAEHGRSVVPLDISLGSSDSRILRFRLNDGGKSLS